jgi:hypothetical protein
MAWADCVANIKNVFAPNEVKEISEVDWSTISQDH